MIVGPENIEIESLDELVSFTWYKPKVNRSVAEGFSLAENLSNPKGAILYPKGTELNTEKIERLIKLRDNNSDWKFSFSIEKSEKLNNTLRERIFSDFKRFIASKESRTEFRKFMEKVTNIFEKYKNEIVNNIEMIYTLYKIRFIEEMNNPEKMTPFYNHLINTCLFMMGILGNCVKYTDRKFRSEDIIKGAQVALLSGIGGANLIEIFAASSYEEQKIRFEEGNKNSSAAMASNLDMEPDVIEAIKLCSDYPNKRENILDKDDNVSDYANIAVIASIFNARISGLYGDPAAPKNVVDNLYILSQNNEVKKLFVNVLAKSIKLGYLFDFYYEIEKLSKACPYGKHGRPYPMTGFKSPVIYVCRGNVAKCRHYVSSSKSVTLFKKTGDLEVGGYGRCEWISNELIKFYDEFYEQIKEDTLSKQTSDE